jgi:hypothetical protein
VAEGRDPQSLSNDVNRLLALGWKLYGHPFVAASQTGAIFAQAVTQQSEQFGEWG